MRFALFSFFWGLQILAETSLRGKPTLWVILPAAIYLLFRPNSIRALLAMSALQIVTCTYDLPMVGNHRLLMALLNLALLLSATRHFFKNDFDREKLIEEWGPVCRLSLLITYFFTFFHKLNLDFLNPAVSCATYFYRLSVPQPLVAWGPNPAGIFGYFLIYSTLLFEALIPLLLSFRKTRGIGILLGLLFHIALGITNYHFSVMVYAIYLLFLPPSFFQNFRIGRRFWVIPLTLIGLFALFFFKASTLDLPLWRSPLGSYRSVVWVMLSSSLTAGYLYCLLRNKIPFKEMRGTFRVQWKPLFVFPLVVFINGLMPYLGIKTSSSYAMFSNLVTEGTSNHLIIPKGALQILDYQDDLVRIVEANQPPFAEFVLAGMPLPYLELRRMVSELAQKGETGIDLVSLRGNRLVELHQAETDPGLSAALPWYFKFVHFRSNDQLSWFGNERCSW